MLSNGEPETQALARGFAATLGAGAVLLISGPLGAGKTAFVRGLAEGLGIDPEDVSSPTFTLVHEYGGGRLPLHHADLYRLGPAEAEALGLDELGARDGVLVIEWPERLSRPIPGARAIRIDVLGEDRRRIVIADVTPSDSSALPS